MRAALQHWKTRIAKRMGLPVLLPDIPTLNARDAYRLWAPTYSTETATSALDHALASAMLAGLPRTRLLDAGCGIGRRIAGIPDAVGIDQSPEMLAAGGAGNVVQGDIRAIPFEADRFDMVWCRLVLGHIADPLNAYREFSRVSKPGAHLFITDFHPDAASAGHRRTLSDAEGKVHAIEHYVHRNHVSLAQEVGLSLVEFREGAVGPQVRSFYQEGIGLKAYRRDLGLKLVAAYLFHKPLKPPVGLEKRDSTIA